MHMLRCATFVQRQHGTLCLVHAFNNMLQQLHLHQSDMYPAFPPGHALRGNYHVHELHRALQHISPHMSLVEGQRHMGATDNAGFPAIVRSRRREYPLLGCAILTTHSAPHDRGICRVLTT